jgi:hypothetical protein
MHLRRAPVSFMLLFAAFGARRGVAVRAPTRSTACSRCAPHT